MNQIAIRPTAAVSRALSSLADHGRAVSGARILLMGVAYKPGSRIFSHQLSRSSVAWPRWAQRSSSRTPRSPAWSGRAERFCTACPTRRTRRGTWSSSCTPPTDVDIEWLSTVPVVLDTTRLMRAQPGRTLTPPTLMATSPSGVGSLARCGHPASCPPCHRCTGLRSAVGHPRAADSRPSAPWSLGAYGVVVPARRSCCSTSPSSVIAIQPSPPRRRARRRRHQPLVSFFIPVHNEVDNIEPSIRSVLNSDYRNVELFVVDDGSDDGTGEVLERLRAPTPAHCDPLRAAQHEARPRVRRTTGPRQHLHVHRLRLHRRRRRDLDLRRRLPRRSEHRRSVRTCTGTQPPSFLAHPSSRRLVRRSVRGEPRPSPRSRRSRVCPVPWRRSGAKPSSIICQRGRTTSFSANPSCSPPTASSLPTCSVNATSAPASRHGTPMTPWFSNAYPPLRLEDPVRQVRQGVDERTDDDSQVLASAGSLEEELHSQCRLQWAVDVASRHRAGAALLRPCAVGRCPPLMAFLHWCGCRCMAPFTDCALSRRSCLQGSRLGGCVPHREPTGPRWLYRPFVTLLSCVVLSWLIVWAALTVRKPVWARG